MTADECIEEIEDLLLLESEPRRMPTPTNTEARVFHDPALSAIDALVRAATGC